jgi:hypothetical protein
MAAPWGAFESSLEDFLTGQGASDPKAMGAFIADEYHSTMSSAAEQYMNAPQLVNDAAMKSMFETAFDLFFKVEVKDVGAAEAIVAVTQGMIDELKTEMSEIDLIAPGELTQDDMERRVEAGKEILMLMEPLGLQKIDVIRAAIGDAILLIVPLLLKLGLLLYWLGGMMKPSAPPPGSVSVVVNMVLFPGVPTITMPGLQSEADFAKQFSLMFQIHALTVFGLTTSLTPVGPAMVPIPYPFVSVK